MYEEELHTQQPINDTLREFPPSPSPYLPSTQEADHEEFPPEIVEGLSHGRGGGRNRGQHKGSGRGGRGKNHPPRDSVQQTVGEGDVEHGGHHQNTGESDARRGRDKGRHNPGGKGRGKGMKGTGGGTEGGEGTGLHVPLTTPTGPSTASLPHGAFRIMKRPPANTNPSDLPPPPPQAVSAPPTSYSTDGPPPTPSSAGYHPANNAQQNYQDTMPSSGYVGGSRSAAHNQVKTHPYMQSYPTNTQNNY